MASYPLQWTRAAGLSQREVMLITLTLTLILALTLTLTLSLTLSLTLTLTPTLTLSKVLTTSQFDTFVLLASDGLWDVFSDHQVT